MNFRLPLQKETNFRHEYNELPKKFIICTLTETCYIDCYQNFHSECTQKIHNFRKFFVRSKRGLGVNLKQPKF